MYSPDYSLAVHYSTEYSLALHYCKEHGTALYYKRVELYTSKGYSCTLLYRIHRAADANVTDTNDPIQDMASKLQFHKSILQVIATAWLKAVS